MRRTSLLKALLTVRDWGYRAAPVVWAAGEAGAPVVVATMNPVKVTSLLLVVRVVREAPVEPGSEAFPVIAIHRPEMVAMDRD